MQDCIEEMTLLLMYLNSWKEKGYRQGESGAIEEAVVKRCWKGYDFDTINDLTAKDYLYESSYKSKSVCLTPKGEKFAKELIKKYIK